VNAELYCKLGLPFVMGTTGGDNQLLYKSVHDSKNYALISPQMGKQVYYEELHSLMKLTNLSLYFEMLKIWTPCVIFFKKHYQVVAFVAAMKIMSEQFPGTFSGYNLEVQFCLAPWIFNLRARKEAVDSLYFF
jgi:4-hydroxy-tetrahydrodipicolinate reductase